MLTFPVFLASEKLLKDLAERARADRERRLTNCKPWTPTTRWAHQLNIQAATFPTYDLFPGRCTPLTIGESTLPSSRGTYDDYARRGVTSPTGEWLYCLKVIPRGYTLDTYQGARRGTVLFDADIHIPCIHRAYGAQWNPQPYMSLTPMEYLTLRPGTAMARGHTVVAGLGLGYQLLQVCSRPSVKRVTLIEKSQELVDWLWPVIRAQMARDVPVDVIVGDAKRVLPTLRADVALVDIYKYYGNNDSLRQLRDNTPHIPRVWVWGSARIDRG